MYTEEKHAKCSVLQTRIREVQSELMTVDARLAEHKLGTREHEVFMKTYWQHCMTLAQFKAELTMLTVQPIRM
jgi:hypothetical protein